MSQSQKDDDKDFVFMGNTRSLLNEVWDHWQKNLGHTPEVARRMMDAAMQEFHKAELFPEEKKIVRKVKSKAKRVVKMARKEVKAVKKAIKKPLPKRKKTKR